MEKEFCTYEQSLSLKELGCDYAEYNAEGLSLARRPLIQQAFRFFREKYELSYSIIHKQSGQIFESVVYSLYDPTMNHIDGVKTYEEAEQSCLDKLIELANESKQ